MLWTKAKASLFIFGSSFFVLVSNCQQNCIEGSCFSGPILDCIAAIQSRDELQVTVVLSLGSKWMKRPDFFNLF